MRLRSALLTLGLAGSALLGGGCGTIFSGPNQRIEVFTEPPRAVVTAGSQQILSPGVLKLARKEAMAVLIEHPGFKTRTIVLTRKNNGYVWVDLVGVAAGALVGAAVAAGVSADSSGSVTISPEAGALVGGIVGGTGVVVDYLTGAGFRLEPPRIVVTLLPDDPE